MADLLQGFELIGAFKIIFPFLFITVFVWAVLAKTKILGSNGAIQAFLALVMGFMAIFSKGAITIINLMAPWFVVLMIAIFFILLAFMLFGISEKDIMKTVTGDKGGSIIYWVIGVGIVITLGSVAAGLANSGGEIEADENGDFTPQTDVAEEGQGAFFATLFHPKVLGLIAIMLISVFTLQRLAGAA